MVIFPRKKKCKFQIWSIFPRNPPPKNYENRSFLLMLPLHLLRRRRWRGVGKWTRLGPKIFSISNEFFAFITFSIVFIHESIIIFDKNPYLTDYWWPTIILGSTTRNIEFNFNIWKRLIRSNYLCLNFTAILQMESFYKRL